MKAAVTNNSKALQGVWSDAGLVFVEPGKTVVMVIAAEYVDRARSLPFLDIGEPAGDLAQLDHDGDGKAGGSLKGAQSTRAKGSRKPKPPE